MSSQLSCRHCGQNLPSLLANIAGQEIKCPRCRGMTFVPLGMMSGGNFRPERVQATSVPFPSPTASLPAQFQPAPVVPLRSIAPNLAAPASRLAAVVVDVFAVAAGSFGGAILAGLAIAGGGPNPPAHPERIAMASAVVGMTLVLMGQMVLIGTRGQSIGKKLLGIRLANQEDDAVPGFLRGVVLRIFVNLVPCVLIWFIYPIVDLLFIFSPERRCLHDLIAGTRVIKVAR